MSNILYSPIEWFAKSTRRSDLYASWIDFWRSCGCIFIPVELSRDGLTFMYFGNKSWGGMEIFYNFSWGLYYRGWRFYDTCNHLFFNDFDEHDRLLEEAQRDYDEWNVADMESSTQFNDTFDF